VRFGGLDGRQFDETFPVRLGICGDEGLGPGGLAAGWRGWPSMKRLLARIHSENQSGLILTLSAPLGIFVCAARETFPTMNILGICELPSATLQQLCRFLALDVADVEFEYVGLNHIGWFYSLKLGKRNLLDEYCTLALSADCWAGPEPVASCGGFPTKYLRLHYDREKVVREQMSCTLPRAIELKKISNLSYQAFQNGDKKAIETALERRQTPWYDHAIVPFLFALHGDDARLPLVLTGTTHLPGFGAAPPSAEVPVWIRRGQLCPKAARP
jgi:6-phospho-beta-glucosidase